jgi:hypothetical protein
MGLDMIYNLKLPLAANSSYIRLSAITTVQNLFTAERPVVPVPGR